MTKQQKVMQDAEQLVRLVLSENFGQKPTDKQVKEVAAKMAKVIPTEQPRVRSAA